MNVTNGARTKGKESERIRSIKIYTAGDGAVGKTSLLFTYRTKQFPEGPVPTRTFHVNPEKITVDNQTFSMNLWDAEGGEDFARLRPLGYSQTDCFLLCYSVSSRSSFEHILELWSPELTHHCPNVPIVLVATKTDLRDMEELDCISHLEGEKMKQKIRASRYVECSAINVEGLQEVFDEAIRSILEKPSTPKRRFCHLF